MTLIRCLHVVVVVPGVVIASTGISGIEVVGRFWFLRLEDIHVARKVDKRGEKMGGKFTGEKHVGVIVVCDDSDVDI